MTYQELIEGWKASKAEWRDYEAKCTAFAAKICSTLLETWRFPDEKKLKLIDPEASNDKEIQTTAFGPAGLVKLKEHGWAEFCLYLTLQEAPNVFPYKPMKILSRVRITDSLVFFKASEDGPELRFLNGDTAKSKFGGDYPKIDSPQASAAITEAYERLIRRHVQDSFKNWRDEG